MEVQYGTVLCCKYFHFSYSCNSVRFTSSILNPPQINFTKASKSPFVPGESLRVVSLFGHMPRLSSHAVSERLLKKVRAAPPNCQGIITTFFFTLGLSKKNVKFMPLFLEERLWTSIYLSIYYSEQFEKNKAVERTIMCSCNFNLTQKNQNTSIKKKSQFKGTVSWYPCILDFQMNNNNNNIMN